MTALLPQDNAVTYRHWRSTELDRARREVAARRQALDKAEDLLRGLLSPWGQITMGRGWFPVKGSAGNHYYVSEAQDERVAVFQLSSGSKILQPVKTYCLHTEEWGWPIHDQMAAYKLWLESDEEKFEWHANLMPVTAGWRFTIINELALAAILRAKIERLKKLPLTTIKDKIEVERQFTREFVRYERRAGIFSL